MQRVQEGNGRGGSAMQPGTQPKARAASGGGACRHVLVVEDNPADVRLLQQAFRGAGLEVEVRIEVAEAGDAALDLLHDGAHPKPDLVLLDLNLPRRNGREVLAEVKADPLLRRIPIIVLSGSTNEDDVRAAFDLHANAYVVKPIHLAAFRELARSIAAFWLQSARLPVA
jgi:chemotaxis family two-component system response regulator Rcp1